MWVCAKNGSKIKPLDCISLSVCIVHYIETLLPPYDVEDEIKHAVEHYLITCLVESHTNALVINLTK